MNQSTQTIIHHTLLGFHNGDEERWRPPSTIAKQRAMVPCCGCSLNTEGQSENQLWKRARDIVSKMGDRQAPRQKAVYE